MNIDRLKENIRPERADTKVTIKKCGAVYELRYMIVEPAPPPIQRLDSESYVDLRTGEVKQVAHTVTRADDKSSVIQSMRKLRDLINTNLENPDNALWVTLTFRENMRDGQKLYEDFRRYWQRFKYFLNKHGYSTPEFISAIEAQARGALHVHVLFLFPEKAPFIPNADMERIWGHGFTKTKSLDGITNPGLYLTAYLSDIDITENFTANIKANRLAEVKTTDEKGNRVTKAVLKGGRIALLPAGINLFRYSRGVKKPEVWETTEAEAMALIGDTPLTYEKTIAITSELGERINTINYRQFNKNEKPKTSDEYPQTENRVAPPSQ